MSLSFAFSSGNTEFLDFEMDCFDLLEFDHMPLTVSDTSSQGRCRPHFFCAHDNDSLIFFTTTDSDPSPSPASAKVVNKSSSSRRNGSKLSNTNVQPKRAFRKGLSVLEALSSQKMPNMSRRPPSSVIVAFPHFDRCDSLLYFPHTLIRHFNTTDMNSVSKLMSTHADKDCKIRVVWGEEFCLSTKAFLRCMEISNDLEPDRIMCVHSTKVIENKICSSVYMKLTDSQPLYRLMSYVCQEPDVSSMCIPDRAQRFKLYAKDFGTTDLIKQQLIACAVTNDDVLFYIRMDLTLTFDDTTKKIIGMDHTYELTSLHIINNPVQIDY